MFTQNTYPATVDVNGQSIKFIDIDKRNKIENEFNRIKNNKNYDNLTSEGDIEVCLHIDVKKTLDETLSWIDELEIKEVTELLKTLNEVSSKFIISKTQLCSTCNRQVEFTTNEIPELFAELAI